MTKIERKTLCMAVESHGNSTAKINEKFNGKVVLTKSLHFNLSFTTGNLF